MTAFLPNGTENRMKIMSAPIVIGRARRLISAGAYPKYPKCEATGRISTPPGMGY